MGRMAQEPAQSSFLFFFSEKFMSLAELDPRPEAPTSLPKLQEPSVGDRDFASLLWANTEFEAPRKKKKKRKEEEELNQEVTLIQSYSDIEGDSCFQDTDTLFKSSEFESSEKRKKKKKKKKDSNRSVSTDCGPFPDIADGENHSEDNDSLFKESQLELSVKKKRKKKKKGSNRSVSDSVLSFENRSEDTDSYFTSSKDSKKKKFVKSHEAVMTCDPLDKNSALTFLKKKKKKRTNNFEKDEVPFKYKRS